MNRRVAYLPAVVACLCVASAWYFPRHTWMSTSNDGASGGGFGPGRRGVGYASAKWKSLDGVVVDEVVVVYRDAGEARKDLEELLKGDGVIVERGDGRVVRTWDADRPGRGAAQVAWLDGDRLHMVDAGALEYALRFERSLLKL